MKRVFIIHGSYGSPTENWIPWLKRQLEAEECLVIVPQFPTPGGQTLANWSKIFEPHLSSLDKESIVIGHSVGPAFLMRILERVNVRIRAAFFVAPFTCFLDDPAFDRINETFIDHPFHWDRIRAHCRRFVVFFSDNDPYVPFMESEHVAQELKAESHITKGAGHFNEKAGYTSFPLLLKKVKEEL